MCVFNFFPSDFMRTTFRTTVRCGWLLAVMGIVLLAADRSRARLVNSNTNGISDIWIKIHNAAALDPNGDADGDGFSNWQEALAGPIRLIPIPIQEFPP